MLTGIAALLLCSFTSRQVSVKHQTKILADTVKVPLKSIDSIALASAAMKFKTYKKNAHASYYADKFNGRRTASGSKFNNNGYTAAHRKFPFGTKLRITNKENGKFVIVEVTDRGPFSKGREIDMTRRAFREICNNKTCGGLNVTIDVVEE